MSAINRINFLIVCFLNVFILMGCKDDPHQTPDAGRDSSAGHDSSVDIPVALTRVPFPESFLVINDPPGLSGTTTGEERVDIGGLLVGDFSKFTYQLNDTVGDIPIAPQWSAKGIVLLEGDNLITVTGTDDLGQTHQDSITITYNAGLAMERVISTPEEIFIGQSTAVLITLKIPHPESAGVESAQVFPLDDQDQLQAAALGDLADDGNGVDEAAGDGIYSGQISVDDSAERAIPLRVVVKWAQDGQPAAQALSEIFQITVMRPLDAATIAEIQALQQLVEQSYVTHRQTLDAAETLAKLVEELRGHPSVTDVGPGDAEEEIWWETTAGVLMLFSDYPEGTKGGGEEGPLSATILEPYWVEFGATAEAEPVAQILETFHCPTIDPIYVTVGKAVELDDIRELHKYDVVFIDSHGGATRNGLVYFTLEGTVDHAALADPNSRDSKDLKARRIVVAGKGYRDKSRWHYAVGPKFIAHYNKYFDGSVVHLGSCSSSRALSMAAAFLKNGAAAYTGFTNTVSNDYALVIVKAYYDALRRGATVGEAVAQARAQAGEWDPWQSNTQFVSAPTDAEATLSEYCHGYTRVQDTADYLVGISPASHVTAGTNYFSLDRLERSPNPFEEVFYVKKSRRSCNFHYAKTSTMSNETLTTDQGSGSLDETYASFHELDMTRNRNIIKLEIDREAKAVELTYLPQPADPELDQWITLTRWKHDGGTTVEPGRCSFWGPIGEERANYDHFYRFTEPDVQFGENFISGKLTLTTDRGVSIIEFFYDLEGGTP